MGWLHRLLNPHCEHCIEMAREARQCASCDTLREQLGIVQRERDRLLDSIIRPPVITNNVPLEAPEAIPSNSVPWNLKRVQLELADREKAAQLKAEKERLKTDTPTVKSIEDLEKEVGVVNG